MFDEVVEFGLFNDINEVEPAAPAVPAADAAADVIWRPLTLNSGVSVAVRVFEMSIRM